MASDVFISYSQYDKEIADEVCAKLENEGISCRCSTRNVESGSEWSESAIDSIKTAMAMAVIFTDRSNDDPQVLNEAAVATNAGIPVIPFLLTDTFFPEGKEYFFSSGIWVNAMDKPLDAAAAELCEKIRSIHSTSSEIPEDVSKEFPKNKNEIQNSVDRKKHLIFLLVLLVILVIGAICFLKRDGVPHFQAHTLTPTETISSTNSAESTDAFASESTYTPDITAADKLIPANTMVPTDTHVPMAADTLIPADTATSTVTHTPTSTNTATSPETTDTSIPTDTATPTATDTPIPADTATPTATDTLTPADTATSIVTHTPTSTNTATSPETTDTLIPTDTATPRATDTPTPADTATPTAADTSTPTITSSPTITATPTITMMPTNTPVPLKMGDIFRMGQIKQNDGRDKTEDVIEWSVMDVQDKKVLLAGINLPDSIFPEDLSGSDGMMDENALNNWLNDDFLYSVFSPADIQQIIPDTDGSRIFLLTEEQAEKPFCPAFWISLTSQMVDLSDMDAKTGKVRIRSDYLKSGDEIWFGTYEQNFNPDDGAEPILWQVLEKEGDTALLISKYILTQKPFFDEDHPENVLWTDSLINYWLNNEFYETSFNADEKSMITESSVIDPISDQDDITDLLSDKVFLISQDEAEKYFPSDDQRICSLLAFDPRDKTLVYFFEDMDWWLRSIESGNVQNVSKTGEIISDNNVQKNYGIRPALRIDKSKTKWIDILTEKNREIYRLNIGDQFTFGHYEQDDNISNGSEPLEWLVLDKKGDKVLLISKYTPDVKPWKDNVDSESISWADSTLRQWLNSDFLQTAFTEEEQNRIVPEPDNGIDCLVTLLSSTQVRKYFPTIFQRVCQTTQYTRTHGAYQESLFALWWTRDVDPENVESVLFVDQFGRFRNNFPYMPSIGVRPAIWISLR